MLNLEEKVQEASERLSDLRAQNEELQKREAELRDRVEKLELYTEIRGTETPDRIGWTPIFHAVYGHSHSALQFFIDQGADIRHRDDMGNSLIAIAVTVNNIRALKCLKEQGLELDSINPRDARNAMHLAANRNREAIMDFLISEKVDINARDKQGNTPLHHAITKGADACAVNLIAAGADLGARNE